MVGTTCGGDGPDAGTDAGVDPPSTPIPTSAAPEEASEETVESSAAAGLAAAVRMAIVPGTGEITVHNLLTGEVLQEIMSSPSNTGAFVVRDGAQPYLLSIGNDGASVRGWSGTQWGLFGQVLFTGGPTNVTDASKVLNGGQAGAAILTDNSNSQIHYLSYDSAQSLWALSRPTNIPPENGARAVSAAAPVGDSPVLVAVDGTPGRLWWVDWSVTPAVLTDLGTIGDAPRRTSCSPDGTRCFVPNFGSGTVTVVDTSGATPVVLPAVDVGAGPISVSVAVIGGEIVAVTSGFTDDSLTYLVVEAGGIRTVSETLPDCSNPGHAVLLPDLGRVLVTCNADDTYVMRALPANVP
jgi:DNA-binding beta-propeller fold protein YncE